MNILTGGLHFIIFVSFINLIWNIIFIRLWIIFKILLRNCNSHTRWGVFILQGRFIFQSLINDRALVDALLFLLLLLVFLPRLWSILRAIAKSSFAVTYLACLLLILIIIIIIIFILIIIILIIIFLFVILILILLFLFHDVFLLDIILQKCLQISHLNAILISLNLAVLTIVQNFSQLRIIL